MFSKIFLNKQATLLTKNDEKANMKSEGDAIMKIEKVNDNQIRCTLTKEDLANRQIKLSELAYGTEKAKSLFRDMMQQANFEFGFEAEDIPLMIEAIPLNSECIVLIITKVEDPEELDTRFSRFAPSVEEEVSEEMANNRPVAPLDLHHESTEESAPKAESKPEAAATRVARVFRFGHLSEICDAASLCADTFSGKSSLYKWDKEKAYLLVLSSDSSQKKEFDKACNLLSEYGSYVRIKGHTPAFLSEHCELLIAENALQTLKN